MPWHAVGYGWPFEQAISLEGFSESDWALLIRCLPKVANAKALSSSMKKAIIRTFQAVFTIAILIWLFHSPEKRAQMAGAIAKADRTWLLMGLPVALIGEVANIVRWQILMRVQGMHMSWRRAIMLFFVGLFFNLFMPGYTGGDFARLYYLMREFPDKKKESILTVVMDP